MADRLVVIGGDAAGMSAATNARRGQPYLEIVALEKGAWTSYSACGIPYLVGGEVESLDDLVARSPQQLREQHRIDVRLHHEVVGIDLAMGQLEVRDQLRQRTITMGFDRLHIATGAQPLRPEIPGIDDDHVFGVQTLEDAKLLLERARLAGSQQVVVIGGGYIGLEMAEAFVRHGASVTLVEAGEQVMSTLDRDVADRLVPSLRGLGIDVRLNEKVEAIEPESGGHWRRRPALPTSSCSAWACVRTRISRPTLASSSDPAARSRSTAASRPRPKASTPRGTAPRPSIS